MSEEIWKPVVGYGGNYEVSSHGRVKAKARTVRYKDGRSFEKKEHVFAPKPKQGYPSIDLPGGKVCIHTLVATAFIGRKPDEARTVNHKDGDKTNNHCDNLEWASYAANNRHARLTKLNRQHGEKCNLTEFGDDVVDAIRLIWPTRRFTQAEIARLFCMSVGHVHEIVNGKSRIRPTM